MHWARDLLKRRFRPETGNGGEVNLTLSDASVPDTVPPDESENPPPDILAPVKSPKRRRPSSMTNCIIAFAAVVGALATVTYVVLTYRLFGEIHKQVVLSQDPIVRVLPAAVDQHGLDIE